MLNYHQIGKNRKNEQLQRILYLPKNDQALSTILHQAQVNEFYYNIMSFLLTHTNNILPTNPNVQIILTPPISYQANGEKDLFHLGRRHPQLMFLIAKLCYQSRVIGFYQYVRFQQQSYPNHDQSFYQKISLQISS